MKVNNNNTVRQFVSNITHAVTGIGRKLVDSGRALLDRAGNSRAGKMATGIGGALVAGGLAAHAQSSAPDASSIVTTASTTFNLVGALVASAVGFFIIVGMVKWIRK